MDQSDGCMDERYKTMLLTQVIRSRVNETHGFPFLSGAGRLVVKDSIMMGAALVVMAHSAKAYSFPRAWGFIPTIFA
jgi:hypothetical protein